MSELTYFVINFAVVILSITIHEYAHAKSADAAGDPTPRAHGRVTLNPVSHFDPLGFMMILMTSFAGFGFGWGKPVPVNPGRMKNPRTDNIVVTAWGPFSNLLIAIVCALVFRAFPSGSLAIETALVVAVYINLSLCVFNLIPLFPLDGSHIFAGLFLRDWTDFRYWNWQRQFGPLLLMASIAILPIVTGISPIRMIIRPAVTAIAKFLFGVGL
ncbi:MAG: site-2 protease family protein [Armatimonadetes bacterium]|nr:site-2 protease family protein [Armatimonadota bacterium]